MEKKEGRFAGLRQLPVVELGGDRRVLIEHHQKICRYTREEIVIAMEYGQLRIQGQALELARISLAQLVITGRIDSLSLERGQS